MDGWDDEVNKEKEGGHVYLRDGQFWEQYFQKHTVGDKKKMI